MIIDKIAPGRAPEYLPKQPGEYEWSIADIEKAKTSIGYEPRHGLRDKLDEVIQGDLNQVIEPLVNEYQAEQLASLSAE